MTFIPGIFRENEPQKRGRPSSIPCACGCGEMIDAIDERNRPRKYAPNHAARMQVGTWSPAMVEKLQTMWGLYSTKAIADALGVTKNAVVGRAGRMGLKNLAPGTGGIRRRGGLREVLSHEEHRARERVKEAARRARKRLAMGDRPKRAPKLVIDNTAPNAKPKLAGKVPRPMVDLEPSRNITIAEMTRETCAYPTSSEPAQTHSGFLHRMCGCPVEPGKSWCPGHMAIVFPKSTVEAEEIAA